jgi:hypothetical protein
MPNIGYLWRTVAAHDQVISFLAPSDGAKPRRCPSSLSGPQVYRFLFSDSQGKAKCSHIGETKKFDGRYQEYRNKRGVTERYLRANLEACSSLAYTVELQFFDFEQINLGGIAIVPQHFGDRHVRRLVECWATLCDHRAGIRILNSRDDLNLKSPGHPEDFVGEKKKSRQSLFSELDKRNSSQTGLQSLGG